MIGLYIGLSIVGFILLVWVSLSFYMTRKIIFNWEFTDEQVMDEDATGLKKAFDLRKYVDNMEKTTFKVKLEKYNYEIEVEQIGKGFDKAIIFHHGIMNPRSRGYKYAKYWNDLGYACFVYDGPGWANDKDFKHTTFGKLESYVIHEIIKEHRAKFKQFGLHGESMGGGAVYNYVKNYQQIDPVDFVVIDSSYVDFGKLLKFSTAKMGVPFGLFKPMVNLFFKMYGFSIKSVSVINDAKNFEELPILIFHSTKDEMVNMEQFDLATNLFSNNKNLLTYKVEDSEHVRIIYKHPKEYFKMLQKITRMVKK